MLHPIITRADGTEERMGTATGFIVERESVHYLITNWHIVDHRPARQWAADSISWWPS